MKRIVVSFGGRAYDDTLQRIAEDAPRFGATDVWIYDEPWLMAQPFYRQNSWAWEHPGHRGRKYGWGWYIWKPHVILHALGNVEKGDIVMFLDADTYPIADFSVLFDICQQERGFMLFEAIGQRNRAWVKRDVWHAAFPGEPHDHLLDTPHTTARFMLFERGSQPVRSFLNDWNRLCTTPGLTTRDPSAGPEYEGFEENRGDQSCLSVMQLAYGLPLHREADAFGESSDRDRDRYPQLFVQEDCRGCRADLSGSKYRRGPGI